VNPTSQRDAALESLEAIRDVLDRSTRYTHLCGSGIVLGGLAAIVAGFLGEILGVVGTWSFLGLWSGAFAVAISCGAWTTARKAKSAGEPLWNRKLQFVLARFSPSLVVAALFTAVLVHIGRLDLAPGVWLGLYGLGVLSVSMVLDWEFQVAAWSFIVSASVALFLLRTEPHAALTIGFGLIHVTLGTYRLLKEHRWLRTRRSLSFRN